MSNFGKIIKRPHKSMSRALGFALTLGDFSGWWPFIALARAHLAPAERAALAWAALKSLDTRDDAEAVAETVLCPAGYPLPTFLRPLSDARHWAAMATPAERKAYALAGFEALSHADQTAFIRHITEVEIAA